MLLLILSPVIFLFSAIELWGRRPYVPSFSELKIKVSKKPRHLIILFS